TVARLDVTSMTRTPSIEQAVVADREHRAPDAGEICVYETRSAFGEINVSVPPRAKRTAETYWSDRTRYFATFSRSARPITDTGRDAWLGGEAMLHVLIHNNEHFTVSTQMGGRGSGD